MVVAVANEKRLLLNQYEQHTLAANIVDEMVGLGPLEPLLRDVTVNDILINGPLMIYVERKGKLELTKIHFRNNAHVLHVAQRIASSIGRRVDELSPMLDARLSDGSRVNVIIPPLSLKGPCISIRKFSKAMMDLAKFIKAGTVSPELARALEIIAHCRLNVLISGGTGSGKTTLLNAMSGLIERANGSSPSKTRPNFSSSNRMSFNWKRGRPTSKAKGRSPNATWCAMRSACGRIVSSSARSAVRKPST